MFDNNNNTTTSDPVRDAMARANLGIRPNYLPLGLGVFEIDRLHWGASPKNGQERMSIRLICVSHSDTSNVGKAFEHRIDYNGKGNRTLSMVLADFTRFLILPFGADAAKAIQSDAVKDLIVNAYKEKFASIVQNQGLPDGKGGFMPYKGKRLQLNCVQGKPSPNGTPFTNVFPDVAPAA